MASVVGNFVHNSRAFFSQATVEPMMALYTIGYTLSGLATHNLNLDKACRVNLAYNVTICDALQRRETNGLEWAEENVQRAFTSMAIWKTFLMSIFPAVLTPLAGSWSDKTGRRKPCWLVPVAGELLTFPAYIISTYFFYEIPMEVCGLIEAIIPSITGSWTTLFMGTYSYLAEVTTEESRTFRLAFLAICYSVADTIGLSVSGIFLQWIGYYGVFSLSCIILIIAFYFGYIVPEKSELLNESSKDNDGSSEDHKYQEKKEFHDITINSSAQCQLISQEERHQDSVQDGKNSQGTRPIQADRNTGLLKEQLIDQNSCKEQSPKSNEECIPSVPNSEQYPAHSTLHSNCILSSSENRTGSYGLSNFLRDFFDTSNIKEALTVFTKERAGNLRIRILLVVITGMIVSGPWLGEMTVMYNFTRLRFNWNEVDYSYFLTFLMVINLIGTSITVGVFSHMMKMDDAIIGIISCVSKILAGFIYAFATTTWMIYLAPIVDIANGTSYIAMRSIASKLVPPDELGKLNSVFGMAEAVVPVVYGPMYNAIYNATRQTVPGAFFLIGGALTAPAVFIFLWLYGQHRQDAARAKAASATGNPVESTNKEMTATQSSSDKEKEGVKSLSNSNNSFSNPSFVTDLETSKV